MTHFGVPRPVSDAFGFVRKPDPPSNLTDQGPQTSSDREILSPISLRPPLFTIFSYLSDSFLAVPPWPPPSPSALPSSTSISIGVVRRQCLSDTKSIPATYPCAVDEDDVYEYLSSRAAYFETLERRRRSVARRRRALMSGDAPASDSAPASD